MIVFNWREREREKTKSPIVTGKSALYPGLNYLLVEHKTPLES